VSVISILTVVTDRDTGAASPTVAAVSLVFAYGTLRAGQPNHSRFLAGHRGRRGVLRDHRLHAGAYPWIEAWPGGRVVGEVFDVDDHLLAALDDLEGADVGLYRRAAADIALDVGRTLGAWVWIGGSVALESDPVVAGGDWLKAYAWYVAYGSNLCRERFLLYLAGGPHPVTGEEHRGAREATPPRADLAVSIPHRLVFSRTGRAWEGGGVAFVDPAVGSGVAHGRAWLITREQLADVLAQEAGCDAPVLGDDVLRAPAPVDVAPGRWYGCVVPLGDRDGWPMATFTAADAAAHPLRAPGPAYRDVVARGLREIDVGADEIDDYLAAAST
jgi:gamma-glutamylcyclotransferase (GGCT)/AIG2-like uncharacterized protein YtfP